MTRFTDPRRGVPSKAVSPRAGDTLSRAPKWWLAARRAPSRTPVDDEEIRDD